ncbi:MAG: hypothetical protein ACKO56_12395 [Paracoccaceae bacterium]
MTKPGDVGYGHIHVSPAPLADPGGIGGGKGFPGGTDNKGGVFDKIAQVCAARRGQIAHPKRGNPINRMNFQQKRRHPQLRKAARCKHKLLRHPTRRDKARAPIGQRQHAQMFGTNRQHQIIARPPPHPLFAQADLDPVGQVEPAILGQQRGQPCGLPILKTLHPAPHAEKAAPPWS